MGEAVQGKDATERHSMMIQVASHWLAGRTRLPPLLLGINRTCFPR